MRAWLRRLPMVSMPIAVPVGSFLASRDPAWNHAPWWMKALAVFGMMLPWYLALAVRTSNREHAFRESEARFEAARLEAVDISAKTRALYRETKIREALSDWADVDAKKFEKASQN